MKRCLLYLVAFVLIFSISFASAEVNKTLDKQSAERCMNSSILLINEMNSSGFNVQRVNDLLKQGQSLYEAQLLIEEKRSLNYDFLIVLPYCEDIQKIRNLAFSSKENLNVLIKFYNSSVFSGLDTVIIDQTMEEIKKEIESERYENVDALVSKCYEQINSAIASYSKLNALYSSASSGILRFFYVNRILLITILVICLIFFIFYYKKMKIYLLKIKIKKLELRKSTIKGLIMKSQKEFFEKGSLSEGNYNIRIKKFGELILDIDRQIPLLNEALGRLIKKKPLIIKKETTNVLIAPKRVIPAVVAKKLPSVNKNIKKKAHHLNKKSHRR